MLSGPDRFGPSVLVITAGSETVMLTSSHLINLNNFFLPVFRPWPPGLSQPDRERRRLALGCGSERQGSTW